MSENRKPPKYASTPGARQRTRISGQFAPRLIEMLESHAWRVLSLSGRRLIDRIEIELARHGGNDNGSLPVTYEQFTAYGIHDHCISPAIRETVALGFIEVTEQGRGGNAEWRTPSKYRLTFRHTDRAEPTHEWRRIKTIDEAEALARKARNQPVPKTEHRWRKTRRSLAKTTSENTEAPLAETASTAPLAESTSTLDISAGYRDSAPWTAPTIIEITAATDDIWPDLPQELRRRS
jgi:hypothetical protein